MVYRRWEDGRDHEDRFNPSFIECVNSLHDGTDPTGFKLVRVVAFRKNVSETGWFPIPKVGVGVAPIVAKPQAFSNVDPKIVYTEAVLVRAWVRFWGPQVC